MDRRPNLLLILTDQQHAGAMSCAGDPWLATPHLDALAARGLRFLAAQTAFPLCSPARASLFTGRMPAQLGYAGNHDEMRDDDRLAGLGHHFARHGYDCAYAGKWHIDRGFVGMHRDHGFRTLCGLDDRQVPEACAAFLREPRRRPFLLVAGFDDPHNICEWSKGTPLPWGELGEPPPAEDCPGLPANFAPPAYEAEAAAEERAGGRVQRDRAFGPDDWRRYRWAYRRLVERADAAIGRILAVLADQGLERETLVACSSDHGDGDAAHRLNQKSLLYQESLAVPLILAGPGVPAGRRCAEPVQTGIDLLPTLCGLAGLELPRRDLPGADLGPLLRDPDARLDRPAIVSETRLGDGDGAEIGRSLRAGRWKYSLWRSGRWREQLVDLEADPGEMANLAVERRQAGRLDAMRGLLRRWMEAVGDPWVGHYAHPGRRVPLPGGAW